MEEAIKKIWPDDAIKISIYDSSPLVSVHISKSYSYLPLGLKELIALANIFGTDRFTVNSYSTGGCPTCDFGSTYDHTFDFQKSDIGHFDAPGLQQSYDAATKHD